MDNCQNGSAPVDLFGAFARVRPGHVQNRKWHASAAEPGEPEPLFLDGQLSASHEQISAWPDYQPTPLVSLSGLASQLNVAEILYKDEGNRFGLGSFKALGGAYAVNSLFARKPGRSSMTVTSATDGNHGLSVAWGARSVGCRCVIFIHAKVSSGRERALRSQGAEVIRIDGNYDESVRQCYEMARVRGWAVISDTSKDESGNDIARIVMAGYSVMVAEIVGQLSDDMLTHVFVQGGVGGLAATVCEYFRLTWGDVAPRCIIVEPDLAPCLFDSARIGKRSTVNVVRETVMAGLSCGEVSFLAWPTICLFTNDFLTIPDSLVAPTMRLLADSVYGDPPIVAGESAVAGLAGFMCSSQHADLTEALQLNNDSRVLLIGTEGATDPALYEAMTGRSAASVQHASIQHRR